MSNTISISAEHPALPGHFPGAPVVPGVVIIEHIRQRFMAEYPSLCITGIKKLKFLQQLKPMAAFTVDFAEAKQGGVRFTCRLTETGGLLADGHLAVEG